MGTNFYLMSKSKKLMRENFAVEKDYGITDEEDEKEKQAQKRFHVYERSWRDVKYWEDPDYPFDWTEGEFC